MKSEIPLITLVILIVCAVVLTFMAMVAANGYSRNTGKMVVSWLACATVAVIVVSSFSGHVATWLARQANFNGWLAGGIAIFASKAIFALTMILAFIAIIAIFGNKH